MICKYNVVVLAFAKPRKNLIYQLIRLCVVAVFQIITFKSL